MLTRTLIIFGILLTATGCEQMSTTDNNSDEANGNEQTTQAMNGQNNATVAVCELVPIGDSGVFGTIHFTMQGNAVRIHGEITGLEPGKHGFHVHESGDLSDKESGKSAGGHFNPTDDPHGRPSDADRHVGDLGNIVAGEDGTATIDMTDEMIELAGEYSILKRALVVHAEADKFTQPTGDAGARVAFGRIELASK